MKPNEEEKRVFFLCFPCYFVTLQPIYQREDYGKEDICIPGLRGDYRVGGYVADEAGAVGTSGGREGTGHEGGRSGGVERGVAKGDA